MAEEKTLKADSLHLNPVPVEDAVMPYEEKKKDRTEQVIDENEKTRKQVDKQREKEAKKKPTTSEETTKDVKPKSDSKGSAKKK